MSSDGKLSGAVKSAVMISSDAMKCKEWWPKSWYFQDLLYLDGNEFYRWIYYEEFWVGFSMNPTHEINRKRCNLEKNFVDNCKRLTKVSSYNLQFIIK